MTLKLAAPNDGKETGYFVEEVVNGPLRKATLARTVGACDSCVNQRCMWLILGELVFLCLGGSVLGPAQRTGRIGRHGAEWRGP